MDWLADVAVDRSVIFSLCILLYVTKKSDNVVVLF